MALDFLKEPEVKEIVNAEYSDVQLKRARDYIKNYSGEDLHRDYLRDVDFDITPDNREDYWKIYYATSPLTKEQTNVALIKDIDSSISSFSDPLESLMFLRDGASKWSDEIVEYYAPQIERYNDFFTADTLHKSTVAYEKELQGRVGKLFKGDAINLDPMVSESRHIEELRTIERYNLWGHLSTNATGRFGITSKSGDWIPAHSLEDSIAEYEEFDQPAVEEQLAVSDVSTKIFRQFIRPYLGKAREKLMEDRREANDTMYTSLKSGLIGKSDAAPIIVNQIQQSDQPLGKIIRDSIKGLTEQDLQHYGDPSDILRSNGKILGEVLGMIYLRGEL
jgi:hypothetical protein